MKLFTKHTPDMRGRIRITIETDAVVVREMATNLKDTIRWAATSPEVMEIYQGFVALMARIEGDK